MKKIYDSVHRFIHVDRLEKELINTPAFQRLHYIHQLGMTYFVYPGGTHRRFEHSLGVLELATRIYDTITKNKHEKLRNFMPTFNPYEYRYWRRVLRLSALCHDIGHLPFSHMAENRVIGIDGHEAWTQKILESEMFDPIWEKFHMEALKNSIDRNVKEDVIKIALGTKKCKKKFSSWERVLTEIITGDFFGADRIDYLLRDAQCTGLTYGLFDYYQLIEMLQIIFTPDGDLLLGVEENGIASCEALLLARHYMHKRLYQHPSVKALSYHLARFMKISYPNINGTLHQYLSMTDNEVLVEISIASKDQTHPGYFDAKAICFQNDRFLAIPFTTLSEENVLKLKKQLGDQVDYELCNMFFYSGF